MNNNPVGVFDSGVGGVTVVKAIQEELPREHLIYFGDTARFPYGPRPLDEVKKYVFEICEYLIGQDVKLIVIACNTGTAAGLKDAQKNFNVPILGVIEPGARGAVLATKNRRIGVIGTKGTIESHAYDEAIHALDAGVEVKSGACPRFVDFAEGRGGQDGDILEVAQEYLYPLLDAGIDTLILGCTHYPMLRDVIQQTVGSSVTLISSADETALEVKETLVRRGLLNDGKNHPHDKFIVTGDRTSFLTLSQSFLGRDISKVEEAV